MDAGNNILIVIIGIIGTLLGSVVTIIGGIIKEKSNRKTQIKLHQVKLYSQKKFNAYNELFYFIDYIENEYNPDESENDFFYTAMKYIFDKRVKKYYVLYTKSIRTELIKCEQQYRCMNSDELTPKIPFENFFYKDLRLAITKIKKEIEKTMNDIQKI